MKMRILMVAFFAAALAAGVPAFAQETDPAAPAAETGKAANTLYARLQVPLPFVATDCSLANDQGQPVRDAQGRPIPAVCDLSDYIRGVYRLLIGLAALFAVVMIIIGGYQWIFSGGSSDKTGAAKKRIFGAAIGLMLALLSYIILNTITPRLVALRLPDVEPVGTIKSDFDETCQSDPTFIEYEKKHNIPAGTLPVWYAKQSPAGSELVYVNRKAADCGRVYNVDGDFDRDQGVGKIGQCRGGVCENQQACFQGRCIDAMVYGTVTWNKLQNPLTIRDYLTNVEVYKLCEGFFWVDMWKVGEQSFTFKPDEYGIPGEALSAFDEKCPPSETYLGYALKVYVDDGYGSEDNAFLVGNDCSAPFAKERHITLGKLDKDVADKERLITSDMIDQNFECNLDLTRPGFTDYDGD